MLLLSCEVNGQREYRTCGEDDGRLQYLHNLPSLVTNVFQNACQNDPGSALVFQVQEKDERANKLKDK